ncbi:MAG: TetR family transcriptional regulator C-terminal domain-containing protein [Spirochaetales bacterium]|nr:TetR family transcriptional regulator C-terminal domain-containing protein [Spirochaetales bacterium]
MQKIEDFSVYNFALNFFKYFKVQEKLIIALLKSGKTNILFDCFSKYLDSIFINIKDKTEIQFDQYNISFIAGGLYKTLIQWLSNGAIENENDMAEKINQIISRL